MCLERHERKNSWVIDGEVKWGMFVVFGQAPEKERVEKR